MSAAPQSTQPLGAAAAAGSAAAAPPVLLPVARVFDGRAGSDGAGVKLTRVLEPAVAQQIDPFLLFDEFRSDSAADYIGGFPPHPHRGFETVTYMLAGRMRHGDNKGNRGDLGPGSVQWMTAARGIVHEEMPQQESGLMWGFQLWVNLPARNKMDDPAYQDIPPERIPQVLRSDGVAVRVIAGSFAGDDGVAVAGPVRERPTGPVYFDVRIPAERSFDWEPPPGHTVLIHGIEGEFAVGPDAVALSPHRMALLHADQPKAMVRMQTGVSPVRFLLIAGRPLREPVAHLGPFVMNTREELSQAVRDYHAGRF